MGIYDYDGREYTDELTRRRREAEAELDEALAALRRLVEALPKCDECNRPATRADRRGVERFCDKHGRRLPGPWEPGPSRDVPEYPRAAPLREAIALLAKHGSAL